MTDCYAELLDDAMRASSVAQLFEKIVTVSHQLGFEYVAYGSRQRFPLTRQRLFLVSNYSDAWKSTYASKRYLEIDPYVAKCLKSQQPVVWDECLKTQQPEFWDDAQSHGLTDGWGQALADCKSQGLVTFARSGETITPYELKKKQAALWWLGHITHMGMGRLFHHANSPREQTQTQLSQREREILQWTADGKSSDDIAVILGISQRTVNFHIDHSIKKLDCQNKIAAAVKASLLGLLW